VSPEIVSQLVKNPDQLSLKGEQKELTVLFSDIRGFTGISEKMDSEALGRFMNEYLTAMSDVVMEHGGTVDKFIGDAIMAIWGAPHDDPDHAAGAVRCALGMIERLEKLQSGWERRGLPRLEIGVGINTGVVSVGNFGSRDRFDYTVMGDHVNLASRLEEANKNYGTSIIISEYTKRAIGQHFFCRFVDKVRVKGKDDPVSIYEPLVEGEGDESLIEEVNIFENAAIDYQARNFQRAYDLIQGLYQKNPTRLYAIYMHRAKAFMKFPPPADWDGVERRPRLPERFEI
jgi:adenylate cyclase